MFLFIWQKHLKKQPDSGRFPFSSKSIHFLVGVPDWLHNAFMTFIRKKTLPLHGVFHMINNNTFPLQSFHKFINTESIACIK